MLMLARRPDSLGIYVHFPYCLQKCHYCDFFSVSAPADAKLGIRSFLDGIEREWLARISDFEHFPTVDSVFFGGGTSSLLPPEALQHMLSLFRRQFVFSQDCEITLEGNPENMTPEYVESLTAIGFTRINVGIQTFSARHLQSMNRFYDEGRYAEVLATLSQSSFPSRGADLIYGFAGQTFDEFLSDLRRVTAAGLEHISVYSLTEEKGTPYAKLVAEGSLPPPDEDLQERIFNDLPAVLAEHGYTMYEISNYAKPGFACRHNLRYWLYEPYMGLGPGAHGFNGRLRYGNVRNIERWAAAPSAAIQTLHEVDIDLPLNMFRLTLPFRLSWLEQILDESQSSRASDVRPFFADEVRLGHGILVDDDRFQWTRQGRLVLDGIIERWALNQNAK